MLIIIDRDYAADGSVLATHQIETDPSKGFSVQHPTLSGQRATILEYLAWLQVNRTALAAHGWLEPTKLKGHPSGTTRWQILVLSANAISADAAVKALGLT